MIHLTIDEKPITVVEGRSLLEACREHGFPIPTLCYHPALEPYGACRLCVVEVSYPPRPPRLVAACVYPCEEGAVVKTDSEPVQRGRRIAAELLLGGAYQTPEILALAHELGVKQARFKMPEENPCVLCGLCVRACREIVGVSAIGMSYRGVTKQVSPPLQVLFSRCIGCGTCVLICPTSALKLSDVTGLRSVHPLDSDYRRVYCQLCSDADLSPHFVQDVAEMLGDECRKTSDK